MNYPTCESATCTHRAVGVFLWPGKTLMQWACSVCLVRARALAGFMGFVLHEGDAAQALAAWREAQAELAAALLLVDAPRGEGAK